jgi:hypothetical protein
METVLADLNALLETLDEDDAKAIREALAEKDDLLKAKARTERDLRLATDSKLKDSYPRAFRAYEMKELDFGDAISESDVLAILKTNEEKLAKLGVPVSLTPPAETPPVAAAAEPAPDPAAAFGTPVAGGTPAGSRNLPQEFLESMKADSSVDREKMVEIVGEMNKKGARDQVEQLVDVLNARPIINRNVGW